MIAGNQPDVICITEVIPKAQALPIGPSQLAIPGYAQYCNFDPSLANLGTSGKRGVCIFVAQHFQVSEVCFPYDGCEHLWLRTNLCGGDVLLIGGVYRSPSADVLSTSNLCNLITEVANSSPSHLLIMGDFNFSSIDWSSYMSTAPPTHPSHAFLETILDCYLVQHVRQPTRYRHGDAPHTLDLIFSNEEGMVSNLILLPALGSSDHEVLCFQLSCYTQKRKPDDTQLNLNRGNYNKMAKVLNGIQWDSIESTSLEEHYKNFTTVLKRLMLDNIPYVRMRQKKSIYMTGVAFKMRNRKHKLWKRYVRSGDEADHKRFVRTRNDLRSLTRSLRRNFERQLVSKLKENVKPFWKYVNSRMKTKSGIGDLRRPDGTLTCEDLEKANLLSEFFASVFTKEDTTVVPTLESEWEGSVLEQVEVTPALVQKRLLSLRTSTSPGPDQIPSRVLQELATPLSAPICSLFSKSLGVGELPDEWKLGSVVPIHKSGSRQEPSNYRPVSLTAVLSKVLEGIVRDKILEFLTESGQLHDAQHGFLPQRSCATQLLSSLEDWTRLVEDGEPVDIAYLDFKKAFDSVPHNRLIQKLHDLGIRGSLLKWIQAFLTGRNQQVVVNGKRSDPSRVMSGIPQGSVLGPTLFVIFVNDLPACVRSNIKLFADDTKLYASPLQSGDGGRSQLQIDLDALTNWSITWQLPFNQKKCKVVHLGSGNPRQEYSLLGAEIAKVNEEKDLGIFIDEHLKFRRQAAAAVAKANQILGIIRRSFELLDTQTLPLLFKTLVRPHLEYGNIVWGPFNKEDQRLVERVQRRATRLVRDLQHLQYQERLRALRLPSLFYRRRRGDVIMVYMLMNGHLNLEVDTFFQPAPSTGTRGHPLKVAKPRAVSRARRNHWSVRSVNDWNSLPSHVVLAPTTNEFKTRLDKHWCDHMYDICTST